MKWTEARKTYPDKWLLFEAVEAHSENGKRIVDELSVINVYDDGRKALEDYAEKYKKDKTREMYVYNTKNEELRIEEKNRFGICV